MTSTETATAAAATSKQKIWVLYASQTGNSEQAANKIVDALADKCNGNIYGEAMQLDDFLELQRAPWTPIVIICLSSYGVGQAPMGGYRFRELCDYILTTAGTKSETLLQGLQFAILGLGDSKYTTFFQNPTQTNEALEAAGAQRIGAVGKADASACHPDQVAIVDEWIAALWKPLNEALLLHQSASEERLQEMQQDTIRICEEINPDFVKLYPKKSASASSGPMVLSLVMIIVAIAVACFLMKTQSIIPSIL